VSAFVPYKRLDIAIEACRRIGASLRIVGDGPDRSRLERASGPRIEFLGRLSDEQVRDEYRRAYAVILPGEEDFGIVPVEAQACGCPVVALGRGGALETVIDGETGILVAEPTAESLGTALERAAAMTFDPERLRGHAEQFSTERHVRQMKIVIDETTAAPVGARW
jgi:glycosyltransferase involved in cell wall biosynthesis